MHSSRYKHDHDYLEWKWMPTGKKQLIHLMTTPELLLAYKIIQKNKLRYLVDEEHNRYAVRIVDAINYELDRRTDIGEWI